MTEAELEAFIMAHSRITTHGAVGWARPRSRERCMLVLLILGGGEWLDLEKTAHLQLECRSCRKSHCYSVSSGHRANILLLVQGKPLKTVQLEGSGIWARPSSLSAKPLFPGKCSSLPMKHHSWSWEDGGKSPSWEDGGDLLLGKSRRWKWTQCLMATVHSETPRISKKKNLPFHTLIWALFRTSMSIIITV